MYFLFTIFDPSEEIKPNMFILKLEHAHEHCSYKCPTVKIYFLWINAIDYVFSLEMIEN